MIDFQTDFQHGFPHIPKFVIHILKYTKNTKMLVNIGDTALMFGM